jgi:hypothetical protein
VKLLQEKWIVGEVSLVYRKNKKDILYIISVFAEWHSGHFGLVPIPLNCFSQSLHLYLRGAMPSAISMLKESPIEHIISSPYLFFNFYNLLIVFFILTRDKEHPYDICNFSNRKKLAKVPKCYYPDYLLLHENGILRMKNLPRPYMWNV